MRFGWLAIEVRTLRIGVEGKIGLIRSCCLDSVILSVSDSIFTLCLYFGQRDRGTMLYVEGQQASPMLIVLVEGQERIRNETASFLVSAQN